jgi:hypothetical protein
MAQISRIKVDSFSINKEESIASRNKLSFDLSDVK